MKVSENTFQCEQVFTWSMAGPFLTRARAYLHIYLALEHMTVARKAKLAEFSIWNYFMRRPPVLHYNNT